MDIQSMYSGYRRWVAGKQDRVRTANSVRPSFAGSRGSTATATATATAPTTAAPSWIGQPQPGPSSGLSTAAPSWIGQPQPGPSSGLSPSASVPLDPALREFRRSEDAFDYRRFSRYASGTSRQRDASRPDGADPPPGRDSSYAQDYRGRWGRPAASARPPDLLKVSTCPFASTTEYRDQYRAWQVAPSYPPRRDTYARPVPRTDRPATSYARDFRGLQGDPAASARPPDNLRLGISPFEAPNREVPNREAPNREAPNREAPNREAPAEYLRMWLVPPPQRYRPEYVRPEGRTEFSTSYGQDFRTQEGSKRFLILPRDQIRLPKAAFHDKTTYNSDYQATDVRGV